MDQNAICVIKLVKLLDFLQQKKKKKIVQFSLNYFFSTNVSIYHLSSFIYGINHILIQQFVELLEVYEK